MYPGLPPDLQPNQLSHDFWLFPSQLLLKVIEVIALLIESQVIGMEMETNQ